MLFDPASSVLPIVRPTVALWFFEPSTVSMKLPPWSVQRFCPGSGLTASSPWYLAGEGVPITVQSRAWILARSAVRERTN